MRNAPMTGAAVLVVVVAMAEDSDDSVNGLVELLGDRGREAEIVVARTTESVGEGPALDAAVATSDQPLVIVTRAGTRWSASQLDPLLDAIDRCDHAVGGRTLGLLGRVGRWISGLPWRWVFAVPTLDIHSPYRMHRLDKLKAIPLQSRSAFVNVELFGKATFLGHLIDEVAVPSDSHAAPHIAWSDVVLVFQHPEFVRKPALGEDSGPSEDPQGDHERDHRPGGEDQDRGEHVEPTRPFEDHGAERIQQLSERQRLDERLDGVGEAFGREEDAGTDPHRQHHEIHQATDRLGGRRPTADEQADPGERQGS